MATDHGFCRDLCRAQLPVFIALSVQMSSHEKAELKEGLMETAMHSLQQGAWTEEENKILIDFVNRLGKKWVTIGKNLNRFPDSCRKKYRGFASLQQTNKNRGVWTEEENKMLVHSVQTIGKKWILIGDQLNRLPDSCRDKYREDITEQQTTEKKNNERSLTYSIRSANLSNAISNGRSILRKIVKPTKRNNKRIQDLRNKKSLRDSLRISRKGNGLTTRNGFVKESTMVLFDDTRNIQSFESHPFFYTIPYACIRETIGNKPFVELRCLEKEILDLLKASQENYTSHKYGANEGVNCGMSFSGGGILSNKENGISGTVQWSGFVKKRPDLRRRLCQLFQKILEEAFHDCLWYKQLLHLTTNVNKKSGCNRTLSGLPLTGLWFNIIPKQEAVHCDRNVVGSTFVLSTYEGDGADLILATQSPNNLGKLQINPPMILAGKWANYAHCNTNVTSESKRTSWTLYLDRRVFSKRYVYNVPNGTKN